MRAKLDPRLKLGRIKNPFDAWQGDAQNGYFRIRGPMNRFLIIIASNGMDWDHVSAHVENSYDPPVWAEMAFVKDLFFGEEEAVMQLHPPKSEYVNCHPGTLHLWRPQKEAIPLPSRILVGPRMPSDVHK